MVKIISMFKALLRDKRGKKGPVMEGTTILYKAVSKKYEKLARWLNIEKIVLEKISWENFKSGCRFPGAYPNVEQWFAHGLANEKLEEYYNKRKTNYERALSKSIKKGWVTGIYDLEFEVRLLLNMDI